MKEFLKHLLKALFMLLASPFILLYWLVFLVVQNHGGFYAWSQSLSLLPGKSGSYFRMAFYRFTMQSCDGEGYIGFGTLFSHRDISLGSRVYIGPQCNVGLSKIGEDCLFGSGVHILSGTGQHAIDDIETPIQQQGGEFVEIEIGADTWIGNGAIVMANVGKKCIVGAGSVVTEAIPDYSIAVGNPARVIRSRV